MSAATEDRVAEAFEVRVKMWFSEDRIQIIEWFSGDVQLNARAYRETGGLFFAACRSCLSFRLICPRSSARQAAAALLNDPSLIPGELVHDDARQNERDVALADQFFQRGQDGLLLMVFCVPRARRRYQ